MTISSKEVALLGLVNEKPKHAYEIENDIKERDMRYWTEISMSSVYKLLNKLERNRLLESEIKLSENNVSQKIYSITSQGVQVLKEEIRELVSSWQPSKYPVDIALSNLKLLNKTDAIEGLNEYSRSLDEMIECYKKLETKLQDYDCDFSYIQLATRRICLLKAEKEWIINFITKLQEADEW
ncbi:PadR family transcriptional regulator [uncultured Methanolobus sp.]|uniref:PadR family transcriptional regulator n=1 Tax=uncultured Methanolobus sp. TaxID=218300 RepID=UPI002AABFDA0|nr:PadR family transcriptional regulator [uncultured Methanolobus sp.]